MFEEASRQKLRFPSVVGTLSVEDLWDLPLQSASANRPSLDSVAKQLNRSIEAEKDESFVTPSSSVNAELTTKLDIVKHIIKVLLDEIGNAEKLLVERQQREKILKIIARKEDAELEGRDLEELRKML